MTVKLGRFGLDIESSVSEMKNRLLPALTLATLALLAGVFFQGCDTTDSTKPAIVTSNTFPNSVGSWWMYERLDSLTMVTDTVTVTVSDSISILNPEGKHIWTVNSSWFGNLGLIQILINGDSISVARRHGFAVDEMFILPFDSGSDWRGKVGLQLDSSEVLNIDSLITPAGQFENAAMISRRWANGFEGDGGKTLTHIVAGVGIVKRHELMLINPGGGLDVVTNDEWTLLDYLIK